MADEGSYDLVLAFVVVLASLVLLFGFERPVILLEFLTVLVLLLTYFMWQLLQAYKQNINQN